MLKSQLSDRELVRQYSLTAAFQEWLKDPSVTDPEPIDEAELWRSLEERNQVRRAAQLPQVNIVYEFERLKSEHQGRTHHARIRKLADRMIEEVHGLLVPADFTSLSGMAAFFAHSRNLIEAMVHQECRRQSLSAAS